MISTRLQGFTETAIREMTRVDAQPGGISLAPSMPNVHPHTT